MNPELNEAIENLEKKVQKAARRLRLSEKCLMFFAGFIFGTFYFAVLLIVLMISKLK